MRFNFLFVFLLQSGWEQKMRMGKRGRNRAEKHIKTKPNESKVNDIDQFEWVRDWRRRGWIHWHVLIKKMKLYNNNKYRLSATQYSIRTGYIYKLLSFSIAAYVDHSIFFSTALFYIRIVFFFCCFLRLADVGNFCFLTFRCRGINLISLSLT